MLKIIMPPSIQNNEFTGNNLTENEQRTIVKIIFKICDVVCQCVLKYLDVFTVCWNKSVDCIQITMCEYIKFLDSLCKTLLVYPTCIYTCISATLIVGIACTMVWLILP